jgi:hypothetical protein
MHTILIDSSLCDRNKKVIIHNTVLCSNSLSVCTANGDIHIKCNDVKFTTGQKIKVSNICSPNVQLSSYSNTTQIVTLDSTEWYLQIQYQHGLLESQSDQLNVNISDFVGNTTNNTLFGNIPISFINDTHAILTKISGVVFNTNIFYIKLNKKFNGNATLSQFVFSINILHICGIPLNVLNTINNNYHTITQTNSTGFFIHIDYITLDYSNYQNVVDNNIACSLIDNVTMNSTNSYRYYFDHYYSDITSITIKHSIFYDTRKLVESSNINTIQNNNSITFKLAEYSDTYNIYIDEGNYTKTTLKNEIEDKFNKVSLPNNNKLYALVDINSTTLTSSMQLFVLSDYLYQITILSTVSYYSIIITSNYHNVSVGDDIIIIAIHPQNTQDIRELSNIILTTHTVTSTTQNTYTCKFITTLKMSNYVSILYDAYIAVPVHFKLYLNTENSFGDVLGFRYIGSSNSVTPYKKKISNRDQYINEHTLTTYYNYNIMSFAYTYIYIVINNDNFDHVHETFGGILLGMLIFGDDDVLIDSHISYDILLKNKTKISYIDIKFVLNNGTLYDFKNKNHMIQLILS